MTKLVKIYGERNTNTNYLSKLFQLNLSVTEIPGVVPPYIMTLQQRLPGTEFIRDLYFQLTYSKNLGWKHACVKPKELIESQQLVSSNLFFITITKNPYSWLLSLHRNPYHQYYKNKPPFEEFLQQEWKTVKRDGVNTILKNPIELWNIKNRSYLQLTGEQTTHLTTEEIFDNPENVINNISHSHNVRKVSNEFINYQSSTKNKHKDSNYYRNYYLTEKWKEGLSQEAIAIINDSIDRPLMEKFGYQLLT